MLDLNKYNFIVYQFGKVASTSIVNSLNNVPNVVAFQSHFMGGESFHAAIKRLSDPNLDDYFYHHMEGQLLHNIRLERVVAKFKSGQFPDKKLCFISVARNPVEYARSALLQNIDGYISGFELVWGRGDVSLEQFVESSVNSLISVYMGFLSSVDISDMKNMLPVSKYLDEQGYTGEVKKALVNMLQLMLRPLVWYERNFCNYLDLDLSEMEIKVDNVLFKDLKWCEAYIFKYEELNKGLEAMLSDVGLIDQFSFSRDNKSSEKQYDNEFSRCFSDAVKEDMLSLLSSSKYCKTFGY